MDPAAKLAGRPGTGIELDPGSASYYRPSTDEQYIRYGLLVVQYFYGTLTGGPGCLHLTNDARHPFETAIAAYDGRHRPTPRPSRAQTTHISVLERFHGWIDGRQDRLVGDKYDCPVSLRFGFGENAHGDARSELDPTPWRRVATAYVPDVRRTLLPGAECVMLMSSASARRSHRCAWVQGPAGCDVFRLSASHTAMLCFVNSAWNKVHHAYQRAQNPIRLEELSLSDWRALVPFDKIRLFLQAIALESVSVQTFCLDKCSCSPLRHC